MKIIRASEEHLDLTATLFNAYRIFYKQKSNYYAARHFIQERLENNESVIFLAFDNETAVGLMQLYPFFSSVSMQRTWILNDLYVDEKSRRKGVAELLINVAKEFALESNSKWLLLQTASDNIPAQHLYEKTGWQKETDIFYRYDL